MSSYSTARPTPQGRRRGQISHLLILPSRLGIRQRRGWYTPRVIIVIVLILTVIGPPGQVEAALAALAALFPLLGGPKGATTAIREMDRETRYAVLDGLLGFWSAAISGLCIDITDEQLGLGQGPG